jgi:hypothetical protein
MVRWTRGWSHELVVFTGLMCAVRPLVSFVLDSRGTVALRVVPAAAVVPAEIDPHGVHPPPSRWRSRLHPSRLYPLGPVPLWSTR